MAKFVFILLYLASSAAGAPHDLNDEKSQTFWLNKGKEELRLNKIIRLNNQKAKNIIVFIGDGMGLSTITASRIYKGQTLGNPGEETVLNMDTLPYAALSKTYSADRQVPDSATTATAILSGVKINDGTIGVDGRAVRKNCSSMAYPDVKVSTIMDWFIEDGRSAGLVTTARVTHATPAAAYAHVPERGWETDALLPSDPFCAANGVKDIAAQLVDENPAIKVIMGGGRRAFLNRTQVDPDTGTTSDPNRRADGRDLIQVWLNKRREEGKKAQYAWNVTQLNSISPDDVDFLLGLFNPSHMQYEADRNSQKEPSIAEMTEKAIKILRKDPKGFFLLVEGGRIDQAHHDCFGKRALVETIAFDDAVRVAKDLTSEDDTLLIVTADHSHVFTIAGYPKRGNNILGFVDPVDPGQDPLDNMPFLTLSYANGPGPARGNLTGVDTTDKDFRQPVMVRTQPEYETHGGEDVAIFSSGPMSFLFRGVHEQSYIAQVMGFAACVGPDKTHCTEGQVDYCGVTAGVDQHGVQRLLVTGVAFGLLVNALLCS